jgi:hypothetical protein
MTLSLVIEVTLPVMLFRAPVFIVGNSSEPPVQVEAKAIAILPRGDRLDEEQAPHEIYVFRDGVGQADLVALEVT